MATAGVHDARQNGDDGEFRNSKRQDTQRKADKRPKGDALLLRLTESVDVATIATVNGDDGQGNRRPAAYLARV